MQVGAQTDLIWHLTNLHLFAKHGTDTDKENSYPVYVEIRCRYASDISEMNMVMDWLNGYNNVNIHLN